MAAGLLSLTESESGLRLQDGQEISDMQVTVELGAFLSRQRPGFRTVRSFEHSLPVAFLEVD